MRCAICDAWLSPDEMEFEHDHGNWAPCFVCKKASEDKPEYSYYNTLLVEPEFDEQLEEVPVPELRLVGRISEV
jgi:hypothetical protein